MAMECGHASKNMLIGGRLHCFQLRNTMRRTHIKLTKQALEPAL